MGRDSIEGALVKLASLQMAEIRRVKDQPNVRLVVLAGEPEAIDALTISETVFVEVAPSRCPLTRQQLAALRGLREGLHLKEIAQQMGVGVSTVRTHLQGVYRRLEVRDRAQAVLVADEEGWL
jgi:DNA-binding NarL/FixJ family response regulator